MSSRLLNRSAGSEGPGGILLATDGSEPALMATMKAVELCKATGNTLHVLMVKEELPTFALEKISDEVAEEKYLGLHSRGLEVAQEWAARNGIKATVKLHEGGPVVAAILQYAREIKPAFIVMGSAGRSGWEKLTLGSVAEGVMRHSDFPVVMTKGVDPAYISDILEVARKLAAPWIEEEVPVEEVPIESLGVRRKLLLATGTLLAFLVPYFGLGAVTSFNKDLAVSKIWGDANVAIVWVMILFPIGWATAILFNHLANRMEERA